VAAAAAVCHILTAAAQLMAAAAAVCGRRRAVYSYPWLWWPSPFAEEVLKMYQDKRQKQQQQPEA
jgi:hypothetical protein